MEKSVITDTKKTSSSTKDNTLLIEVGKVILCVGGIYFSFIIYNLKLETL
jgi:hypothetical protein